MGVNRRLRAVRGLVFEGYSVRDSAALLGITAGRVSQVTAGRARR